MIFLILSEFFGSNWVSSVRGVWTWAYLGHGLWLALPQTFTTRARSLREKCLAISTLVIFGERRWLQSHCRVSIEQSPAGSSFPFLPPLSYAMQMALPFWSGHHLLCSPQEVLVTSCKEPNIAKHLHEVKHERDHQSVSHVQLYLYIPCLAPNPFLQRTSQTTSTAQHCVLHFHNIHDFHESPLTRHTRHTALLLEGHSSNHRPSTWCRATMKTMAMIHVLTDTHTQCSMKMMTMDNKGNFNMFTNGSRKNNSSELYTYHVSGARRHEDELKTKKRERENHLRDELNTNMFSLSVFVLFSFLPFFCVVSFYQLCWIWSRCGFSKTFPKSLQMAFMAFAALPTLLRSLASSRASRHDGRKLRHLLIPKQAWKNITAAHINESY